MSEFIKLKSIADDETIFVRKSQIVALSPRQIVSKDGKSVIGTSVIIDCKGLNLVAYGSPEEIAKHIEGQAPVPAMRL